MTKTSVSLPSFNDWAKLQEIFGGSDLTELDFLIELSKFLLVDPGYFQDELNTESPSIQLVCTNGKNSLYIGGKLWMVSQILREIFIDSLFLHIIFCVKFPPTIENMAIFIFKYFGIKRDELHDKFQGELSVLLMNKLKGVL